MQTLTRILGGLGIVFGLAVAGVGTQLPGSGGAVQAPVVATTAGRLRGGVLGNGIAVFKGVHYGESTALSARFLPPKAVAAWDGVQDATRFGDVCPQAGEVGRRSNEGPTLLATSENCLVLNVWTPGADAGRRPVMVWFHGRGFYAGSGSERLYDGARLARRGDLVVVTVNHRLNVFGYLYLGKAGGDRFAASGNAGVQDMQLALEWVRDNIAGFGGDPANVTIFGESGGGAKVSTLLALPSTRGLFRRAIIQSGARLAGMPIATATRNADTVMSKLKVKTVEELQALPMETVLAAVTTTGRTTPDFGPVTDGAYLPADMFTPVAAASARGIPVIVGTNRDEHALYARDHPLYGKPFSEADLRNDLASDFKDPGVEPLLAAYRTSRPGATPWELMVGIRSNRFHISAIRLAEAQSKVAPTYQYSFDFAPAGQGAGHGAEIPFVFSNATANPTARPGAKAVEDAMSEAWIAFARTGTPNHPGMPVWPTYDATTRAVMVFNAETAVVNDPRSTERKVWEGKTLVR
jgi:para-nitrobenzyl esterase